VRERHDAARTSLGRPTRPATEYFLAALETVRANKKLYAEAEASAHEERPMRPPYFASFEPVVHPGIGFVIDGG
jgi:hypothetical protein